MSTRENIRLIARAPFNQSKSVPVNKDRFKPNYSCHFILPRIYLYALDTSTPLFMYLCTLTFFYKDTHYINTSYAKLSV